MARRTHFIRCAKELPDISIAYGLPAYPDDGSESDDLFAGGSETESEDDILDTSS